MKKAVSFLSLLIFAATLAMSATIYVDSGAAPGGDGSQGHPFQTIAAALDALAVINAGDQGGHTISVAQGTYAESLVLTNIHSGLLSAPNMLLGAGQPVIRSVQLDAITNL